MEKYVHYGCKVFDKDLFINITNMLLSTKPYGGFWAFDMKKLEEFLK